MISLHHLGNIYIADRGNNNRIRKVTVSTGIISTIAGTGTDSYSGDGGAATSAALCYPTGVALDAAGISLFNSFFTYCFIFSFFLYLGNVYIADSNNNRIRKVTVSTGIITTLAGNGATTFSGDNGPATSGTLNYPTGVALDSAGTSFICR